MKSGKEHQKAKQAQEIGRFLRQHVSAGWEGGSLLYTEKQTVETEWKYQQ